MCYYNTAVCKVCIGVVKCGYMQNENIAVLYKELYSFIADQTSNCVISYLLQCNMSQHIIC